MGLNQNIIQNYNLKYALMENQEKGLCSSNRLD